MRVIFELTNGGNIAFTKEEDFYIVGNPTSVTEEVIWEDCVSTTTEVVIEVGVEPVAVVVDRFYRADYDESSRSIFEYDGTEWAIRQTPNSPSNSFVVKNSGIGKAKMLDSMNEKEIFKL